MLKSIQESLEKKSTEELLSLYEAHDFDEWSEDAFIAMNNILESRGQSVAKWDSFDKKVNISKDTDYSEAADSAIYIGATIKVLAVIGFVIMVLITGIFTKANGAAILISIITYGLIATVVFGIGSILSCLGMLLSKSDNR